MVNWQSRKLGDILLLANGIVFLILVNILSSLLFFRLDLTEEGRYSIKVPTKELLASLEGEVHIEVFLAGELNAGFRRFQKSIRETLEEFRVHSDNKIQYTFTDPATAMSSKAQAEFMNDLAQKGIQPTRVVDMKDGQRIEKIIYPGAVVSYGVAEKGVHLLKGNKARSQEEEINQSIEGIEFELANAIYALTNDEPRRVGWVTGHGEIGGLEAASFMNALSEVYAVGNVSLASDDLSLFDALIIARPTREFSEKEKYRLDQYIMRAGKVLFLLDKLQADMDSVSQEMYFAFPYELNLDDQLFRYGVRINMDLVQDRTSGRYPVVTNQSGTTPQIQLMPWEFFPLITNYADHPITRNLDAVVLKFVSSIDTVKATGITKTPLFFTSHQARVMGAPVNVSLQHLRRNYKPEDFSSSYLPVAYLLEGSFSSLYRNRFLPEGESRAAFRESGEPTRLIVVSDGDLATNVVNPESGEPLPLGFDPFGGYRFANEDLLMNMVAYLVDEDGLIHARNKEVRIRPLQRDRAAAEKTKWQTINIGIPLGLIVVFGLVRNFLRKKRYARFPSGNEK